VHRWIGEGTGESVGCAASGLAASKWRYALLAACALQAPATSISLFPSHSLDGVSVHACVQVCVWRVSGEREREWSAEKEKGKKKIRKGKNQLAHGLCDHFPILCPLSPF
jgi:hypothetical protein